MQYLVVGSLSDNIGGVIGVLVMLYFIFLLFSFTTKVTKVGMKTKEGPFITPDDFDNHIKFLKRNTKKIFGKGKNSKQSSSMTVDERLELLSKLDTLYSKGKISKDEYYKFRSEIMD